MATSKKSAKKYPKNNTPASQITLAGTPVKLSLSVVIPVWVCCLAFAATIYLFWAPQHQKTQITYTSQIYAQQQLRLLDQLASSYQDQLLGFARAPHLHDVLIDGMDAIRMDMEQDLNPVFPAAVSFRIIPLDHMGIAGLSKHNISLRNNIEVDMIRLASEGKAVTPEAYQIDDQWLVSFAQAVIPTTAATATTTATTTTAQKNTANTDGATRAQAKQHISGALLLTVTLDAFKETLEQLAADAGKTSLTIGPQKLLLLNIGAATGSSPEIALKSASLGWQLSFSAGKQTAKNAELDLMLLWLGIAAISVLVPIVALITNRQYGNKIQSNLHQLNNYSEQWLGTNKATLPTFTIVEFGLAANLISKLGQRVHSSAGAQKKELDTNSSQDNDASNTSADNKPGSSDGFDLNDIEALDDILDLNDDFDLGEIDDAEHELDLESLSVPHINPSIFRAYDIRGIAERDFDDTVVHQLGLALGSEALDHDQQTITVGYDGRHSSPRIKTQLIQGIRDSGCNVIDLGLVPTPLVYFATHHLNSQSGVMVTGSHNPADYNGLKIVIAGKTYCDEQLQAIKRRIETQNLHQGAGTYNEHDISEQYIDTIINDVAIAQPLKIVVDCGNGAAGEVTPKLLEELGCEVIPLYCDIDGSFPNHHPDPSILSNLQDLINEVRNQDADLGIALDGDGDRIGVVTSSGDIILPDRLLMLFAQDVVSRNPGTDVIFDVKSTRHLNQLVSSYGGRPIMWKSGHSYIKEKMQETGALLGGELSGHIFFKERWFGFDDGMYAAARLIEILSTTDADLDKQIGQFPKSLCTPELHIDIEDEQKFGFIERMKNQANFAEGKVNDLDGIRADYPDGWGLVRASNTTPKLTLRFEADNAEALLRIQALFKNEILKIDNSINIHF
jgi:phosphomannomutase/phosphoglucomutase